MNRLMTKMRIMRQLIHLKSLWKQFSMYRTPADFAVCNIIAFKKVGSQAWVLPGSPISDWCVGHPGWVWIIFYPKMCTTLHCFTILFNGSFTNRIATSHLSKTFPTNVLWVLISRVIQNISSKHKQNSFWIITGAVLSFGIRSNFLRLGICNSSITA